MTRELSYQNEEYAILCLKNESHLYIPTYTRHRQKQSQERLKILLPKQRLGVVFTTLNQDNGFLTHHSNISLN